MTIDEIIDGLIKREGPYVDHPADRGGPTCWGITEAVARAHGYTGRMQDLPQAVARQIYRQAYYTGPGFDMVAKLSPVIAEELTDTGVNQGVRVASEQLQRALNVLNLETKLFADVPVDGNLGPRSFTALAAFLKARGIPGEGVLLKALNCLQGARYIEIAERRPSQESFVFGWIAQRVAL